MKFSLPIVAILASTVVADLASITAALNDVGTSVSKVKANLDAWKGDLLGVTPIIASSAELVITLQLSTLKIKQSSQLNDDDAIQVASTTADLITNTLPTLDALVAARPKFDKLLLRPVIYLGLLTQKDSTLKMSEAVIGKIPETYKEIGDALIAELTGDFDKVIAEYKPF